MNRALFLLLTLAASPAAAKPLPDVSGTWLMRSVTTSVAEVPVVGRVETQTEAVQLVQIAQDRGRLTISAQTCAVELTSTVNQIRMFLPAPFVDLMRYSRKGTITHEDGEVVFRQSRSFDSYGANLATFNESLPTEPDDFRVVDEDDDGFPGVTVSAKGLVSGDIYVVQKSWSTMRGVVQRDRISGNIWWNSTQRVLGASSVFLESDVDSKPSRDPAKNFFSMTRIEPTTHCSNAMKSRTDHRRP